MIYKDLGVESKQSKFQVAVLCGGIGGSALGYRMAGMNICCSVDKSKKANAIFRENFDDVPVIEKPIELLSEDERLINQGDEIDLLDIYIPVRYMMEPIKNQDAFLIHALKLMFRLKPRIIVFHTQGRFNKGRGKLMANELLSFVKAFGYNVHMETLLTSNYGVAQEKYWTFVIGIRQDIGIKPVFPEVIESDVSTRRSIEDLLEEPCDVTISPTRLELVERYFPTGCTYSEVKAVIDKEELSAYPVYYKRDRWDEPFYALINSNTRPIHPIKNRLLSIQEGKRLQSFPDEFLCSDWKELCSSAPPLIIKRVAESLIDGVLLHI